MLVIYRPFSKCVIYVISIFWRLTVCSLNWNWSGSGWRRCILKNNRYYWWSSYFNFRSIDWIQFSAQPKVICTNKIILQCPHLVNFFSPRSHHLLIILLLLSKLYWLVWICHGIFFQNICRVQRGSRKIFQTNKLIKKRDYVGVTICLLLKRPILNMELTNVYFPNKESDFNSCERFTIDHITKWIHINIENTLNGWQNSSLK